LFYLGTGEGMGDWVAVMTKPLSEEVAARSLEGRGWRVYLPRYRRVLRGVRLDAEGGRHRTRGAGEIVLRPLFRGYLFAEVEGGLWRGIVGLPGVLRLVTRREGEHMVPRVVDEGLIEGVREAERSGEFDEVRGDGVRSDLKIGAQVRVAELDDRVAELVGLDEVGRARVLVEILGRRVVARVGVGSLVAAE
jgi:transcription antitermination factor NusG